MRKMDKDIGFIAMDLGIMLERRHITFPEFSLIPSTPLLHKISLLYLVYFRLLDFHLQG